MELRPPSRELGPARARIVGDTAQVRPVGPRGKTHTPPLGSLDRRAGATGAVGTAPKWLTPLRGVRVGQTQGVNVITFSFHTDTLSRVSVTLSFLGAQHPTPKGVTLSYSILWIVLHAQNPICTSVYGYSIAYRTVIRVRSFIYGA